MSIARPFFGYTDKQIRAKLFARAWGMALLQASGIYLIAHGSWLAGITGFLISYNWLSAAREGVDHRVPFSRLSYALGGATGTLLALFGSQYLYRMHVL